MYIYYILNNEVIRLKKVVVMYIQCNRMFFRSSRRTRVQYAGAYLTPGPPRTRHPRLRGQ